MQEVVRQVLVAAAYESEMRCERGSGPMAGGDEGDDPRMVTELEVRFGSIQPDMVLGLPRANGGSIASQEGGSESDRGRRECSAQPRKAPHVPVRACFNFRGDAPPPLLVLPSLNAPR
jgi:hypothetical protein